MTRYVAFLRGINVGGRVLKMEDLRNHLGALGYEGVRTYIQSGNAFLRSEETAAEIERRIEAKLKEVLGYEVDTFVRSVDALGEMLQSCPFRTMDRAEDERHIVLFTREGLTPKIDLPAQSEKGDAEVLACTSSEVFVRYWIVNGRPADPTKLLKATLGNFTNSGRFYHTLLKLREAEAKT